MFLPFLAGHLVPQKSTSKSTLGLMGHFSVAFRPLELLMKISTDGAQVLVDGGRYLDVPDRKLVNG